MKWSEGYIRAFDARFVQVLERLEKCWNLNCHFMATWSSLKLRMFHWKLKIPHCLRFINVYFVHSIKKHKNNLNQYLKELSKKIAQENSWYAKKFLVFGILAFLYIHACAFNDIWSKQLMISSRGLCLMKACKYCVHFLRLFKSN